MEYDLAVLVFVGHIMVNPPIVLLLEGMKTVGVKEDMTDGCYHVIM